MSAILPLSGTVFTIDQENYIIKSGCMENLEHWNNPEQLYFLRLHESHDLHMWDLCNLVFEHTM